MAKAEDNKPSRKFPPPCWTQQEALSLIDAYRDRWYALRRGYLRTADWEAVATEVAQRCPDASPAKTSAQCRHKMEKLRQRYRVEKQRSLSFPGRFLSSWFYFDNMNALELGSSVTSNQGTDDQTNSGNESRLKRLVDHNLMRLKSNSKENPKVNDYSNANSPFHQNLMPAVYKSQNFNSVDNQITGNYGSETLKGYSSYINVGSDSYGVKDIDYGSRYNLKDSIYESSVNPGIKSKKFGVIFDNWKSKFDSSNEDGDGVDKDSEISGFRSKKSGRIDPNLGSEEGGSYGDRIWAKLPNDNKGSQGFRQKNGSWNPNVESGTSNGVSTPSRSGFGMRGGGRVRKGKDPIEEMVSTIKLLGEGFVKMEEMKMEMAKEIAQRKMEMEMKRTTMILESQQQIVDAFVKGLLELNNMKTMKLSSE